MGSPEAIRAWAAQRRVNPVRRYVGSPDASQGGSPETRLIRVAFAGRTSTDDQQDPTLSLPRQLRNSQKALPDHAVIVGCHHHQLRQDMDCLFIISGEAVSLRPLHAAFDVGRHVTGVGRCRSRIACHLRLLRAGTREKSAITGAAGERGGANQKGDQG